MTMSAARHLGLKVAEDFVMETTRGDAVFVSVRYDRTQRGERWVRLHQEGICQALAVLPDLKYQSDGGPGVAHIADAFRAGLHPAEERENAERFFDAIAFDVAALGTDAHAKNYSLMLSGDHVRLAPLYDLGSHAPYPSKGSGDLTLAMSLAGEYRVNRIGRSALAEAAGRLGLDSDYADERIEAITRGIRDAYAQAADEARGVVRDKGFVDVMVSSIEDYATGRGWYEKNVSVPLS